VPIARRAWLRWAIVLLVGATCFGLGLAMALASPLVTWLLLPPSYARTVLVRAFAAVALATPMLYFGVQSLYGALYGGGVNQIPDINPIASAGMIAAVTANLALAGISGLCLGSFGESGPLPNPTSLLVGALVAVGLVVVALRSSRRTRSRIAAYLILTLACYGSIAVARMAPLHRVSAAAREPRYHYVALLPATLLVCEVVGAAAGLLATLQAPVLIVAALATPALSWQPRRLALYDPAPARQETQGITARIHALAAVPSDAPVCLPNQAFSSLDFVANVRLEFPGWAAVYAIFEPDDTIAGRHIYFVERNREVLQIASRGRRSASLIVSPDRAAALGCQDSF
jgi:hypothetical protein